MTHLKTKNLSLSKPLKLIHQDICGEHKAKSLKGERYFMFLIDEITKATWIVPLKQNLEAFNHFKKFKDQVEK